MLSWIDQPLFVRGLLRVSPATRQTLPPPSHDALAGGFGDPIKAGILAPTKAERAALQDAASISGPLLTTDAVITEIKEKCGGGAPDVGGIDY